MAVATVRATRSVLPRAYALDNAADLRGRIFNLALQPAFCRVAVEVIKIRPRADQRRCLARKLAEARILSRDRLLRPSLGPNSQSRTSRSDRRPIDGSGSADRKWPGATRRSLQIAAHVDSFRSTPNCRHKQLARLTSLSFVRVGNESSF